MISPDLFPEADETLSGIDNEYKFEMTKFNEEGFLNKDIHKNKKKGNTWKVYDNHGKKWRYIEPDLIPITYALFKRPKNIVEEDIIYNLVKNMPRNIIIWSDYSSDIMNASRVLCSYNKTWFGRFTWEPSDRIHKSGGCFISGWKMENGKIANKMLIQIEIRNNKVKLESKIKE